MTVKTKEDFQREFDHKHTVAPAGETYRRDLPLGAKRFVIVAAQNATPVDEEFWPVLTSAVDFMGAELLVIPFRYKNATSIWTASQQNAEWWPEEVRPFLWNVRLQLNRHLTVMADIPMQPTNGNPLGQSEALSGVSSAIFGHPKLQMKTVPTPSSRMAKIMTTTGVCTKENYTKTRLGKVSQFHHSLSAVFVEVVDENEFHMTQLHFDRNTKSITDRGVRYDARGAANAPRALALDAGDMHIRFLDPSVEAARNQLLEATDPLHWIFNDTLDSHSCTPHHAKRPILKQTIDAAGMGNVREEVEQALDYVQMAATKRRKVVIVPSNHDDMLTRWVENAHWQEQGKDNARFLSQLVDKCLEVAEYDPKRGVVVPDAFGVLAKKRKMRNVLVLDRGDSFALANVELGMHGDIGPNGARGSRMNLRRIGVKSIIGHSHCPGIEEGCYQTGTSTYLRLEYNHGASGWLNADVLLNADGKRQVIIYVNGRYCAPRS